MNVHAQLVTDAIMSSVLAQLTTHLAAASLPGKNMGPAAVRFVAQFTIQDEAGDPLCTFDIREHLAMTGQRYAHRPA
jgi:hypothetical protein